MLNKDGIAAFSAIRGSALRSLDREGHRTALLIGFIARKVDSLAVGIVSGLAVGAFFAFLVALGNGYYWQMMLPGAAP